MLGAAAKRIVHPIRKPRNNADEAIAAKPGWDGAGRAICCVAPLANGTCHWLRVASCISSRRASVATTWDLFRGSLMHALGINGFCKRVVPAVDIDAADDRFVILGEVAGDLITHDGMGVGVGRSEQR